MNIIGKINVFSSQVLNRRGLLILAGLLSCAYALVVLCYVRTVPDLGLQTVFGTTLKTKPQPFDDENSPQQGDRIVRIGDESINIWPDVLNAPFRLREALADGGEVRWADRDANGRDLIEVEFERSQSGNSFTSWRPLDTLPLEELVPSVLWFCLKMLLFFVGALVLWKRPTDTAAAQFFLLCVVTLGAYMGG